MAPSVTLVSGGSNNGDILTISGTGFDTKTRSKPWLYADFQSDNNPHSSLSFNTAWAQIQNRAYSSSNVRWGSGVSVSTWSNASSTTKPTTFRIPSYSTTYGTKMMFSYWVRSTVNYLANTGGTAENWKFGMRIWKGPGATGYPNITIASLSEGETESAPRVQMEDWTVTTGQDRNTLGGAAAWGFPTSTWRQETFFLQLNSGLSLADGVFLAKKNNSIARNNTTWRYNHTTRPDHITTPYVQHVIANANLPLPCDVWYSDIYSDDSWNHVVIGNASTFSACTQLEVQPYTGWTSTSITVARRNGTISGSQWLYVIDNSNVANTNGYSLGSIGPTTPPTITSISPSSGPVGGGTTITITGTSFVATPAVKVGGTDATGESFSSSTSMTAVTPASTAGPKDVLLTNPDTSNVTAAGAFTYIAAPTFTSITPSTGITTGGTDVVIVGTGFQSGLTCTIGGASVTNLVLTGSTTINCTTPAGTAGAKNVVITNPDAQTVTGTNAYTYEAPAGGGGGGTALNRTLFGLG